MGIGFGELMVILIVVLILFGAGKLPSVMSEMGKGVKNFKDGMKSDTPVVTSSESTDKNTDSTSTL